MVSTGHGGSMLKRAAFPIALAIALAAGYFVRAPLLGAGFFADDFDHHAMLVGAYPVPRSRFDLFNFGDGTAAETQTLMDRGHFPWWSDPEIHLSMWRPLCSALIAFDFATFGLDARYFHLHSFLWWALCVLAAALVFFHALPPPMAALALLLFAIEEGHSLPLGWLANRSTLVATSLGFLALHAHLRFRVTGSRLSRAASLGWCVLAMSAGEYAFSALAYLFAFELCETRGWRARAQALWPFAAIAGTYLVLRSVLGYGIAASGFYLSPTAAPLSFLGALAWRIPVLIGELGFGVPADWYTTGSPWRESILRLQLFSPQQWVAMPGWRTWHVLIGACATLGFASCLRGLQQHDDAPHARSVRWLAWGALLSLVPVTGGMVSGRLTIAASLGFDALIALLLFAAFDGVRERASLLARAGCAVACALLLYVHVDSASQRGRGESEWMAFRSQVENTWVLSAELDEKRVASQQIMIVAAQDLTTAWYLPYVRQAIGRSMPQSYMLLSGASQPHDLHRVADDAIELVVLTRDVDLMAVGSNYRPADRPFHAGDQVSFGGIRAKVTRVLFGQPQTVRFTFPTSLDDPRYVFLYPTERGLRALRVPPVGERLRLKRPVYPNVFALQAQEQDGVPVFRP